MISRLTLAAATFAVHALAASALAQSPNDEREATAQQLFERGQALYEQRELPAALEAFIESERLVPTPNIAFNIAQTYELIGRYDDAFNWYQRYFSYRPTGAAEDTARRRADALLDRIAVLEISVTPEEAALTIDEKEVALPSRPLTIAVVPGEHSVTASAAGYWRHTTNVEAVRGVRVGVALLLPQITGHVSIDSTPRGALVLRRPDLTSLGRTPVNVAAAPGELRLVLRLDGFRDLETNVRIEAERTEAVVLTLQRTPSSDAARTAAQERGTDPRRGWRLGNYRWIGYGAAAALLGTAIGLGVAAINKKDEVEADPMRRDRGDVDRLNLGADLTGGAAVLTAGVTLALDLGIFGFGDDHAP